MRTLVYLGFFFNLIAKLTLTNPNKSLTKKKTDFDWYFFCHFITKRIYYLIKNKDCFNSNAAIKNNIKSHMTNIRYNVALTCKITRLPIK